MKIEVGVVLPRVLGGLATSLAVVAVGSGEALAAPPLGCLIEPEQVAEVGSPVIGVIEAIQVERGDRVSKGQVLALLRGDVERAAVGVASSRARAEADEQAARSNVAFARQKLERTQGLLEKKFISEQALDQVRTEYEVAEQRLVQAREQKRVAQRELGLAEAQLAQRSIRSPFDGVVAERYLSVGERVEEKPLFRVAKVDPLRVQVVVPAALYGKIDTGAFASVQPQLPETAAVQAQVTLVDQLIDAPSMVSSPFLGERLVRHGAGQWRSIFDINGRRTGKLDSPDPPPANTGGPRMSRPIGAAWPERIISRGEEESRTSFQDRHLPCGSATAARPSAQA